MGSDIETQLKPLVAASRAIWKRTGRMRDRRHTKHYMLSDASGWICYWAVVYRQGYEECKLIWCSDQDLPIPNLENTTQLNHIGETRFSLSGFIISTFGFHVQGNYFVWSSPRKLRMHPWITSSWQLNKWHVCVDLVWLRRSVNDLFILCRFRTFRNWRFGNSKVRTAWKLENYVPLKVWEFKSLKSSKVWRLARLEKGYIHMVSL